jgi:hypothetical protein
MGALAWDLVILWARLDCELSGSRRASASIAYGRNGYSLCYFTPLRGRARAR